MPRIAWIEEGDARGRLAELFDHARAGSISGVPRDRVPDILHTMSHRPDFMAAIMDASRLHFSDGALTRAQHEMIASYVSALNHCHY
jgi:alkylhydroperoxidase family enzyme